MNPVALSLILDVARRVGAPAIERLMTRALGETAGGIARDVAGAVLGEIGARAGDVAPEDLEDVTPAALDKAVRAVEPLTPEIILAHVESQRLSLELQRAEMERTTWSWAWRPATMWLIGALWLWSLVAVPLANAALGAGLPVHLDALIWLTTAYMALYMGGHTVKEGIARWKGGTR